MQLTHSLRERVILRRAKDQFFAIWAAHRHLREVYAHLMVRLLCVSMCGKILRIVSSFIS